MSPGMTPAAARARRAADVAQRRNAEGADALDFLVYGDEDGRHAAVCLHDEPCSRTYDPLGRDEAPFPETMYVGTGVGALYGLPGTEGHLWQLAGWNLEARS